MFDKLTTTEREYEDLLQRLGSAEVQADPAEYRKDARALAAIEPLVQRFREYKATTKAIAQTEELAGASDPDLRELAQEELKSLVGRREALVDELKVLLVNHDPVTPVTLARGDRIAQLLIQRVERAVLDEVTTLPPSERGTGGFGSTGA